MSNVPMSHVQMVLKIHEENYSTNCSFVQFDDGQILRAAAGWKFMISDDGAMSWSEPYECTDAQGNRVGGSSLSMVRLEGKDAVGLAARAQAKDPLPREGLRTEMLFWRSEDRGRTWQEPVVCGHPRMPTSCMFPNSMIRTGSARLVLGMYFEMGQYRQGQLHGPLSGGLWDGQFISTGAHFWDPFFGGCFVRYSDDQGRTWQTNEDNEIFIVLEPGCSFGATFEPSVVEASPGNLLMFMRSGLGRVFQSWSTDNGTSWSRAEPTYLAASHSPARLAKIASTGHLLCVWNQQSEEEIRKGCIRTRLSSAVSRNGGSIWEFFQNVESIHEETRIEPGPIRPHRPEEAFNVPSPVAVERDPRYVTALPDDWGRFSNVTVFACRDRVLVNHSYVHPASMSPQTGKLDSSRNRLKVLPNEWFYGGAERMKDHPLLKNRAMTEPDEFRPPRLC